MRILMVGVYNLDGYSRGRILWKGLSMQHAKVDLFLPTGGLKYAKIAWRVLKRDFDVVLVNGKIALLTAWLMKWWHRKPIVFDTFISDYDTLVFDRKTVRQGSMKAKIVWWSDRIANNLAAMNIIDTQAHRAYFQEEFGVPQERFAIVPVGSDDNVFTFQPMPKNKTILVYWQGTYIPLHGAEVIVNAAKMLEKQKNIRFVMVGRGQTYEETHALAERLKLGNVEFVQMLPLQELPKRMAEGDISLGSFGRTEKAMRVITHKAFDTLSCGRPLLTADTPAHREVFTHGKTAWLVPPNDADALAKGVLVLAKKAKLRKSIAANGHRLFLEKYSTERIGKQLYALLKSVVTLR